MDEEQIFAVANLAIEQCDFDAAEAILRLAKRVVLVEPRKGSESEWRFVVARTCECRATRDLAVEKCVEDFKKLPRERSTQ